MNSEDVCVGTLLMCQWHEDFYAELDNSLLMTVSEY